MCGIAGKYAYSDPAGSESNPAGLVESALTAIKHRGPDSQHVKAFDRCTIGHTRLKILDLSERADQPMTDTSGRYWIVFNGEIFNHHELRKNLIAQGVAFNTHSDTEVLLQLMIHEGEGGLRKLNGFFAFAFYDQLQHTMLIVRDRYGEKPLWYFQNNRELSFASELKGLKKLGIPKEIDIVSLSLFLQFSYIPGPQTIYKDVFKLEPGHYLKIQNGNYENVSWYQPCQEVGDMLDPAKVLPEFRQLINDSVKIRMQADVPVGCFLSGGIDSSVIARLASQHTRNLKTFSVSFEDQPFMDETPFALEVSKHIGSNHEVIPIAKQNLLDEIHAVWNNLDEPFADSSTIAVSLLSSKVRNHVTVALSGDGADELLGGYNKHEALWKSLHPGWKEKLLPYLLPVIDALPESRASKSGNKFRQMKRFAHGLNYSLKGRYLLWASWADESICEMLLTQEVSVRKGARVNQFVQDILADDFNSILRADQQLVLVNDMLTKVDSMSMLHALEVRPPFLDHRLVEFINALSPEFKVHGDERKILLRKTFAGDLPETVFSRPKKGFEVPLENWLRNELKPLVFELLDRDRITCIELIKPDVVQRVLHQFYNKNKSEHTALVYSLMVFEHWFRNHHNSN